MGSFWAGNFPYGAMACVEQGAPLNWMAGAEIVINSRPIATDMNLFVDVIPCYSRSTVLRTVRHVCSCDEQTAQ